jgi:hypothetical protein
MGLRGCRQSAEPLPTILYNTRGADIRIFTVSVDEYNSCTARWVDIRIEADSLYPTHDTLSPCDTGGML